MFVVGQKTGTLAIAAIIAAVVSYLLTFSGHPLFGLVAALLSIPLGIFGFFAAISPRTGGGILSTCAIFLGAIAVVVAVLGIIGVIIF
jgi:hypothetical protein